MKRKVCVVTGSRADYGLLRPLMRAIRDSESLELQIVATGSHLSAQYGNTFREIQGDGLVIDQTVPILTEEDSERAVSDAFGQAVIGIGECLTFLRPDIVVVLGDRYEALAAGVAATLHRIPIAHIHGGETTEGLIDEACRHSLTKMASLHFCATETYRRRILQLGERDDRVHVVGAMAADSIAEIQFLSRDELCGQLGIEFGEMNFLVTYHPVTLEAGRARAQISQVIDALRSFPQAKIFFTLPNAESESSSISEVIQAFAETNPGRVKVFTSLGQQKYLSLLRECDVVIGNSSSALIEAPLVGTVTVNVGSRQRGRLRGSSVFDAQPTYESIAQAIRQGLTYGRNHSRDAFDSPYGSKGGSAAILRILEQCDLEGILIKGFVDRNNLCG